MKLIFLALIGYTLGVPILNDVETDWLKFKEQHEKQYNSSSEEIKRKKIFSSTYENIVNHNKRYEEGLETYFMDINERADMTIEEMEKFNCFKKANVSDSLKVVFKPKNNFTVPSSVDWRTKGAVSPVKDQGECGACWAFSAVGSLEGQYFLKAGKLVELSVQNLIDCSHDSGNEGCRDGDIIPAFLYVHGNDGIDSQHSYPYLEREDTCRYSVANNITSLRDYGFVEEGDEEALKIVVAEKGPISIAVDYRQMHFYKGGIYYNRACNPKSMNHAMLVVGYGTENGQDYWLIKNTYGPNWGLQGYIKLSRNRNNNCGVATHASYPIMY